MPDDAPVTNIVFFIFYLTLIEDIFTKCRDNGIRLDGLAHCAGINNDIPNLNLHYVGVTRAIDVCYLMNGTKRYRSRQNDFINAEPSPFLFMPGLPERRNDVMWK